MPCARSRYGTSNPMRNAPPPRMKKREATRNMKLRSCRMSRAQASLATAVQLRPARSFAARPSSRRKNSDSIVTSSMTPSAIVGPVKSPFASPIDASPEPTTTPSTVNRPTRPLARPTWSGRDEVRHVALERALGEVRAELEQDDERADRQDGVRRRDPDEEHDVQQRPDEDVGLAPPEPADRVVAEGPRDRLDEDGDDHAGALDDARGSCTGSWGPGRGP